MSAIRAVPVQRPFDTIHAILARTFKGRTAPAVQCCVKRGGEMVFSRSYGNTGWEGQFSPTNGLTLFDFSFLTELFSAAAFMRLTDLGFIHLDDPVCAVLPKFSGQRSLRNHASKRSESESQSINASTITFRQLLQHTSGLQPIGERFKTSQPCLHPKPFFDSGFDFAPGSDMQFSASAYLLLGWAIEALVETDLSTALEKLVLNPLALHDISFRPIDLQRHVPLPLPAEGIAPTYDAVWRQRRLRGEVCDANSAFWGGVCGHAGLFGTAEALANFGEAFLPGSDFLKAETLFSMTHSAIDFPGSPRFGTGFQLWSQTPAGTFTPLSSESFGYSGADGIHLLIDPMRELVIAFLTNDMLNTTDRAHTLSVNALWPKVVREVLKDL